MMKPRIRIKYLLRTVCALAALCFSGQSFHAIAQQMPAAPSVDLTSGIELYKQGDDKGAIAALRRVTKKQDKEIAAWYHLALCYTRQGKRSDARKAYERAATSGEWLIDRIYASVSNADISSTIDKYRNLLLMAAESAKKYLEFSSKPSRSKTEEWTEREETLRDYAMLSEEKAGDPSFRVYTTREVHQKARIMSRPEPVYTDNARRAQVTGTVVLRAIFALDGKVRAIRIVKGLPEGLSQQAVRAARRIKFIPASINGQPVSQYIQIEYNFNLY